MASTSRGEYRSSQRPSRDVVALFYASFHPTKGNVVDWCLKAHDDIDLGGVEFKVLPSGLHAVEEDVVYFSHSVQSVKPTGAAPPQPTTYTGVSVFSRRPTTEKAYRGFRLESVGVLLGTHEDPTYSDGQSGSTSGKGKAVDTVTEARRSPRIKPWVHVPGLKQLSRTFAVRSPTLEPYQGDTDEAAPEGKQARDWFEARRFRPSEKTEDGEEIDECQYEIEDEEWANDVEAWFDTLEFGRNRATSESQSIPQSAIPPQTTSCTSPSSALAVEFSPLPTVPPPHPLLHLPSLLLTLGPSSLTVFRFLLARKRVLVLAKPPVEPVGIACWALASLAFVGRGSDVNVLGVVTLHDIDNLKQTATPGGGWVACTTDTLFVEKTECWDLLVDITSVSLPPLPSVLSFSGTLPSEPAPLPAPSEAEGRGRARLYVPKAMFETSASAKKNSPAGLTSVRFTWSDVKLWTQLTRIFQSYTYTPQPGPIVAPTSPVNASLPKARPPPGPSSSAALALAGSTAWMDNLTRLYEDACILCAGVWFASSSLSGSEGAIRLEGEDDLRTRAGTGIYKRNRGMSVTSVGKGQDNDTDHERRHTASGATYTSTSTVIGENGTPMLGIGKSVRGARRLSTGASSMWSLPTGLTWASRTNPKEPYGEPEADCSWEDLSATASNDDEDDESQRLKARREVDVTLAVLRAFQTHSDRLLAKLADTLAPQLKLKHKRANARPVSLLPVLRTGKGSKGKDTTIVLTPKDLLALDLGPLSAMDARLVEWLADAYFVVPTDSPSTRHNVKVVVRKARWRDVVGVVFGFS